MLETGVGSCAKEGITDNSTLYCGSGSLCNDVSLNYVSKLPDALTITSSSTRRRAADSPLFADSTDPNVIFADLTQVVMGALLFFLFKISNFSLLTVVPVINSRLLKDLVEKIRVFLRIFHKILSEIIFSDHYSGF